jgi:hypothetical protein
MELRRYHGGKPEANHQLLEAIDEADIGIRNELGCIQWQHSMAQLAVCMHANGGNFECCNNLET